MRQLFVPYEIAKQLKEKGFDEPCIATYHDDKALSFGLLQHPHRNSEIDTKEGTYIGKNGAYAPLYQQVIDWFRENHNITVSVIGYYYPHLERHFYLTCVNEKENGENWGYIESYYEALDKAIEEALKLI